MKNPESGAKQQPTMKPVHVTLTPRQAAFLGDAAGKMELSVSEVVRRILDAFMRDEEQKKMLIEERAARSGASRRTRPALAGARA